VDRLAAAVPGLNGANSVDTAGGGGFPASTNASLKPSTQHVNLYRTEERHYAVRHRWPGKHH
jgi:hypothetical protein